MSRVVVTRPLVVISRRRFIHSRSLNFYRTWEQGAALQLRRRVPSRPIRGPVTVLMPAAARGRQQVVHSRHHPAIAVCFLAEPGVPRPRRGNADGKGNVPRLRTCSANCRRWRLCSSNSLALPYGRCRRRPRRWAHLRHHPRPSAVYRPLSLPRRI